MFKEKYRKTGNTVFLIGCFIMLMLNWNDYALYTKVEHFNAMFLGLLLVVLFVSNLNIGGVLKDKLFYLIILINVISIANLLYVKTSLYTEIIIFDISLALYLADKIKFSKKEILISSAVIAAFFVYWTIDVKGYFKGYSINMGGEILITGLMFLDLLIEYAKYYLISENTKQSMSSYGKKAAEYLENHIFIFTLVEIAVAFCGYKIIAYYRSRTAFFGLIVFYTLLFALKLYENKKNKINLNITNVIVGLLFIIGMALAPYIYIQLGNKYKSDYSILFFKQIFSNRFDIWPALWDVYKNFPITGIGTMYMSDSLIYRDGLLDACNSFMDLLVIHGPFVCTGIIILLSEVLIKYAKRLSESSFARLIYIIILTMISISYSENYLLTAPFTAIFLFTFAIINSQLEGLIIDENRIPTAYFKDFFIININKLKTSIMISTMLAVLLFILGPLEIFYSNYDEFNFKITDFIFRFSLLAAIFIVVLTMILMLFDNKYHQIICSIAFAAGVGAYVQYMFLNNQLMNSDGELKTADQVGSYAYISLIPWLIILVACIIAYVFLKEKWNTVMFYISGILIIVQFAAIISLPFSVIGRDKQYLWLSGEKQTSLAKNDNIIILEADTFSQEYLEEVLAEYPDAIGFLNDFTYYDNAKSIYTCSYLSIIHMLTGENFEDANSRSEREKKAFANDMFKKFTDIIHEKGYTFNIFTKEILYENNVIGKIDNVDKVNIHINRNVLFNYIKDMSFYRYVPYVMKQSFEVSMLSFDEFVYDYDGVETCWKNSDFMTLTENLHVDNSIENGIFLNHYIGFHIPYINDEFANLVDEDSVPRVKTFKGALYTIQNYLDKLKELGKYDDSVIIILGDHSRGGEDAALFIKHRNEQHDSMIIDCSETNFDTFIPTVVNEIGGNYTDFGSGVW